MFVGIFDRTFGGDGAQRVVEALQLDGRGGYRLGGHGGVCSWGWDWGWD